MSLYVWAVPAVEPTGTAQTMRTARALSLFYLTKSVQRPVEGGQFVVCYQDRVHTLCIF